MGIFFALIAALCQSILWIALKKSYEKLSPSIAFFFDMLLGLLIWIPFSLFIGVDFSRMNEILLYAFISGILSEAFVFFVMSKGEVSYTSTIFSTYPLFTILFSVLFNHESLSTIQWILVALVILGTFIVSIPKNITKQEFSKKAFLIWPLLGAIAVGLSDTLSKSIIDKTSAESFLFGLAFAQIPVAIGYLYYEKARIPRIEKITSHWSFYKFAMFGSLLNVITVLFLWLAFQQAPASIASPITASYPGLVVLFAITVLKEKVDRKDLVGFALIVLSVMGLAYFSP